jgi:hypothetical protein
MNNEIKEIAICYWGLPRSLSKVYYTHQNMIYKVLEESNISYDIYSHTWDTSSQFIWGKEVINPTNVNEINILNTENIQIDNQDEFLKNLNFSQYFYEDIYKKYGVARTHGQRGEWIPQLLRNHLCALESLKRSYTLAENSKTKYKYVMFMRPDVLINNKFNVADIVNLRENNLLTINCDEFNGINDKWALTNFKTGSLYAKRIDDAVEYRKKGKRISSEIFLKYILNKYEIVHGYSKFSFRLIRP